MVRVNNEKSARPTGRHANSTSAKPPVQLALSRKRSTDDSVGKIEAAMTELKRRLISGELHDVYAKDPKVLSLPSICKLAGVNDRFLYGPKHKFTTQVQVNSVVAELEKALKAPPAIPRKKPDLDDVETLKFKIIRLKAQLHSSRLLLNEKRAAIRSLMANSTPTVVRLPVSKQALD